MSSTLVSIYEHLINSIWLPLLRYLNSILVSVLFLLILQDRKTLLKDLLDLNSDLIGQRVEILQCEVHFNSLRVCLFLFFVWNFSNLPSFLEVKFLAMYCASIF